MQLSPEKLAGIQALVDGEADPDVKIARVAEVETTSELQYLANYYNWDDGFDLPTAIANHPRCDLGTALSLFWLDDKG